MSNILSKLVAKQNINVFKTPNLKTEDTIYTIKVGEEYKVLSDPYYNADICKNVVNILFLPSASVIGDGLLGFIENIPDAPMVCKIQTEV